VEQRNDWFDMLIKASHNEGYEWSALSEDVDFTTDYANVKKEVDNAAEQVRTSIVQNTAIARDKETLTRDLEVLKHSRKTAQADIGRLQEEKKQQEAKKTELEARLREMKDLVEKSRASLEKAEAAKQIVESRYKAGHEIFLVIQANHNNVASDLANVMQQLHEVENNARQLDATIADLQKSPELIAAQISQIEREISLANDKKRMEESKIVVLTESEQVFDEKIANLEKRKEEALKMKQSAIDMLQAARAEAESQQLATNLLRTEVDLVVDKEKTLKKEIQQTQELTAQAVAQADTLKRELAALA